MVDVPVAPDHPIGSTHLAEHGMHAECGAAAEGQDHGAQLGAIALPVDGGVPPLPCSISGRVGTPGGHFIGVWRATHLKSVLCSRLLVGLATSRPTQRRKNRGGDRSSGELSSCPARRDRRIDPRQPFATVRLHLRIGQGAHQVELYPAQKLPSWRPFILLIALIAHGFPLPRGPRRAPLRGMAILMMKARGNSVPTLPCGRDRALCG